MGYRYVLIIILIQICMIRLWHENIWVRIYNHQIVKNIYDQKKKPFTYIGKSLPFDLHERARAVSSMCCALKTSKLNDVYRAFNSDQKGGAIYWNQMKPIVMADETRQADLTALQMYAKAIAEKATGKALYPFKFSMWNAFVLKYTGTKGSFGWHYDSEDAEDYRVLICVSRTGGCGKVEYYDDTGSIQEIDLMTGQYYVLRGSTTFHRVTNNKNKDDERLMLGFHFSERPNKVTRNMCYFANLTNWKFNSVLSVWWNQDQY